MAKILVDDDARNLRFPVTALEQAGHEALSAEGGAEGLDGYLEKPIRYKGPVPWNGPTCYNLFRMSVP